MITKVKHVFHFMRVNYRRFLPLFYLVIYSLCFAALEQRDVPVTIISHAIDHRIPFLKIFIIPYYLWFVFIAYGIVLMIFQKKSEDFYMMWSNLVFGMTLFLIVSFLFPNGLDLRPKNVPGNDILSRMVRMLYRTDTPTNVFPSIHVYNSIAVTVAITKLPVVRRHPAWKYGNIGLMVLIILSTLFVKQHSIIDVVTSIVIEICIYPVFYGKTASLGLKFLWKKYDHLHYDGDYDLDWFGQ